MNLYPHVDEDVRPICDMENHIRVAHVLNDRFVEYPAVEKIMARVNFLLAQQKRMRATGVVAKGEPGSGKTALAGAVARRHASKAGRWPKRPVLIISMTKATKAIEIYKRILEELRVPVPPTIKAPEELGRHALRVLLHYQVQLLCVDELGDILNMTVLQQRDTLTAIKFIMNEALLPVFALGTHFAADAMKEDPHLAQRFTEYEIPNWEADLDCRGLLANIEKRLPLRRTSILHGPQLTELFVKLGHGRLREIVELINYAAILAIVEGVERITPELVNRVAEGSNTPPWQLVDAARRYKESSEGRWLND